MAATDNAGHTNVDETGAVVFTGRFRKLALYTDPTAAQFPIEVKATGAIEGNAYGTIFPGASAVFESDGQGDVEVFARGVGGSEEVYWMRTAA